MRFAIVVLALLLSVCGQAQTDPGLRLYETVMERWKDSLPIGGYVKWSYDMGVVLKGFEGMWRRTGDAKYLTAIRKKMDWFVKPDGSILGYEPKEYNIDHINNGKLVLLLYKETGEEKYRKAADRLRDQLRTHPRTAEGGFWHKKIYTWQMWLDGLYMGAPFYAEYAKMFGEDTAFHDITAQFVMMERHARDPKTGLLYHAYDEKRQQRWADPVTGTSPHFWGRAMGWYADAIVDALDHYPANHPGRAQLIGILQRLAKALATYQDKKSGLWLDVMAYDGPGKEKNYFEASASSQFVYALAKGVRMGYLDKRMLKVAKKGYAGLLSRFVKEENGRVHLHGTVKVSGLGGDPYRDGSFNYYMSEPVIVDDPKGIGAFLLAVNEMQPLVGR
jgi:unsaturated rhamnogalacturonyl hydrolase